MSLEGISAISEGRTGEAALLTRCVDIVCSALLQVMVDRWRDVWQGDGRSHIVGTG